MRVFRIRQQTTRESGKDVAGLDALLVALAPLPPDEQVLAFHFSGAEKLFSVFVSEKSGQLLGCIRLARNKTTQRPPANWDGRADPRDRN